MLASLHWILCLLIYGSVLVQQGSSDDMPYLEE